METQQRNKIGALRLIITIGLGILSVIFFTQAFSSLNYIATYGLSFLIRSIDGYWNISFDLLFNIINIIFIGVSGIIVGGIFLAAFIFSIICLSVAPYDEIKAKKLRFTVFILTMISCILAFIDSLYYFFRSLIFGGGGNVFAFIFSLTFILLCSVTVFVLNLVDRRKSKRLNGSN